MMMMTTKRRVIKVVARTGVGTVAEVADPARVATDEVPRVVRPVAAHQQTVVEPLDERPRPRIHVGAPRRCIIQHHQCHHVHTCISTTLGVAASTLLSGMATYFLPKAVK